ncbi:MAG: hypothetical protein ACLUHE_07800 [Christensenellales bacterium]
MPSVTEKGVTPRACGVIVAGDNPASQVCCAQQGKCLPARGDLRSTILRLPESCAVEELESAANRAQRGSKRVRGF